MSRNTWIVGAIAIAFVAAGVALGFAHWEPVAIIGFLTGLATVIARYVAGPRDCRTGRRRRILGLSRTNR
jgi:hypothetical protein